MGEVIRNVWCGHTTIYNLAHLANCGSEHVRGPVVASPVPGYKECVVWLQYRLFGYTYIILYTPPPTRLECRLKLAIYSESIIIKTLRNLNHMQISIINMQIQ